MNQVKEKILSSAQELFFKRGIRAVTIDDIARHIKISKRTIYKYFENKDEIVFTLVKNHLHLHQKEIEKIMANNHNIIEATLAIVKHSSDMMNQITPVVFSDLKTFYPKVWKYFENFKKDFIIQTITKGLKKGQKQGLIRKDINVKLIAYLRLLQINLIFEADMLQEFNITLAELQNQLTKHFLYGIATSKGIKILKKYESK